MEFRPMNRRNSEGNRKTLAVVVLTIAWMSQPATAQAPPPVILEVDLENYVQYWADVADPAKLASVASQTTFAPRTFMQNVWIADVVAVNGNPARGTYVNRTQSFSYRPSPTPLQSIADINRNGGPTTEVLEILHPDGTPVGTVVGIGLVSGAPPPGSPEGLVQSNSAIVGGTGAFLGAQGQWGIATASGTRQASQSEDPSLRRTFGGGKMRMVLRLMPAVRPEVVLSGGRPVVFHADFSPVTDASPARSGELLIVTATGLGPTDPMSKPGEPFGNVLQAVTSPVEAILNGQSAKAVNAIGWPGTLDRYRVDFRVPEGIAPGMATLQLSVAWMKGSQVSIPVR